MSVLDNKYRLLSLLSKNEVSSVFLGDHVPTGRYVIIKIPVSGQEQIALARFEKEYNILVGLDHPNIVKVIDFSKSFPYLVLEYIDGENALLAYGNSSAPLDERYALFFQLHDTVKYLHRNSFIHRDIKPSNIIIEKSTKRAVLSDFETARDAQVEDNIRIDSGDFSPPELLRGISGYFTDTFSLAKLALFLFLDKAPEEKITFFHRLEPFMREDYKKRSLYLDSMLSILPKKPLLYFYHKDVVNKTYSIGEEARIGRGKESEVRIDDTNYFVDEVHAYIKKENERYVIYDNNSINGLWLFDNGKFIRIAQHALKNNDFLSLGWNSRNGPYIAFRFFI